MCIRDSRSATLEASWVLQRISSCMPRPVDSARSSYPHHLRILSCCLRCALKPSASGLRFEAVPALQVPRWTLRPTSFSVYAYLIFCSSVTQLLNEINTRYGWLVKPYPTGTFTPQDTLSFAQRDNAHFSRTVCGGNLCVIIASLRAAHKLTLRTVSD